MWKDKDESWNFLQDYDPELIKEEKRKELESEIRLQVGPCALGAGDKPRAAATARFRDFLFFSYPESKLFLNVTKKKRRECKVT